MRRTLLPVVLIILVSMVSYTAFAGTAGGGEMVVSPTEAKAGAPVEVSISGDGCVFPSFELPGTVSGTVTGPNGATTVNIPFSADAEYWGTTKDSNLWGNWATSVTIPGTAPPGVYEVNAFCSPLSQQVETSTQGADPLPFDYSAAQVELTAQQEPPDHPDPGPSPPAPDDPEDPEEPEPEVEDEVLEAPPADPVEAQPSFTG